MSVLESVDFLAAPADFVPRTSNESAATANQGTYTNGPNDIPYPGRGPFLARISKIVGPFGEVPLDPDSQKARDHLARYPKYPLPRTVQCSPHDPGASAFIKPHVRFELLRAADGLSALELSKKIPIPKERVRRSAYAQFIGSLKGVPDEYFESTTADKINLAMFVDRYVSVELKPAIGGVARIASIKAAPVDARFIEGRPIVREKNPEELKALLIDAAVALRNNGKGHAMKILDNYFRERSKTNFQPAIEVTISMSEQIEIWDAEDYERLLRKYADPRLHFETYPEVITGEIS